MTNTFGLSAYIRPLFSITVLTALVWMSPQAHAATVNRAKGKAVEILVDSGEDFVKGDSVYIVTGKGKKVGKVKIVKVKGGGKVIGKLLKGKAPEGAKVQLAKGKSGGGGGGNEPVEKESGDTTLPAGMHVGIMLGYTMDTQKVTTTGAAAESVNMTGSAISFKGYADFPLSGSLSLLGRAGLEGFKVTGTSKNTATCGGSTNCSTSLNYLTTDLLVKYAFGEGTFVPFVSGGLGLAFPMSKTTNILNPQKIATTSIIYVGGGAVMQMGHMFIPLMVEYALFPPAQNVNTNFIAGRVGVGWNF